MCVLKGVQRCVWGGMHDGETAGHCQRVCCTHPDWLRTSTWHAHRQSPSAHMLSAAGGRTHTCSSCREYPQRLRKGVNSMNSLLATAGSGRGVRGVLCACACHCASTTPHAAFAAHWQWRACALFPRMLHTRQPRALERSYCTAPYVLSMLNSAFMVPDVMLVRSQPTFCCIYCCGVDSRFPAKPEAVCV